MQLYYLMQPYFLILCCRTANKAVYINLPEVCRMLLQGRHFEPDECGRAFVSLPLAPSRQGEHCAGLVSNLDLLLETMTSKALRLI